MNVLDLFSGIGGFSLGLERAGMRTVAFCEPDKHCRQVLANHWPQVEAIASVQQAAECAPDADVIAGGDPCPSRSIARGDRPSKHPDLSGWFLAVVGRKRPRWVVRENVLAPDALDFAVGLAVLGYRPIAVAFDARDFTSQSRRREFVIGCPTDDAARQLFEHLLNRCHDFGFVASRPEETTPIAACLTAHPMRLAAEDSYCFEQWRGLRVLHPDEAEGLQGFPRGWTAGFPARRRRAMLGNAVVPATVELIGRAIMQVEQQ